MSESRRVFGVRSRDGETERLKFCCDFETEERFNDRFDVFHVEIKAVDLKKAREPFFTKLVEQSEAPDWELFRFRVPDRETETEVIFSNRRQLAVFDEFEEERRSMATSDSDELTALCERKFVARALSVEGAVTKFLNQKLGLRRR